MEKLLSLINSAGQFLPVTVIGAVILFLVKEYIETKRRKKTNSRKRKALRRLIVDEVEDNIRISDILSRNISTIADGVEFKELLKLSIREGAQKERYLRSEWADHKIHSESKIIKCKCEALSNHLIELAMIDEEMFDDALQAVEAVKSLNHVADTLVEKVSNQDSEWLESFVDFARAEVLDSQRALLKLQVIAGGHNIEPLRKGNS